MTLDRQTLVERIAAGERFEYLFFWGHTPRGDTVDASCLSQWFPAGFDADGTHYPTAEHYMMAAKARLFGDVEALGAILEAPSPREAKALGRRVRGFDEAAWARARTAVVVAANEAKFRQHPELGAFLVGTGECVLVEASPRDRVWGIGLGRKSPAAADPRQWRGENLLGFALMEVRARLGG